MRNSLTPNKNKAIQPAMSRAIRLQLDVEAVLFEKAFKKCGIREKQAQKADHAAAALRYFLKSKTERREDNWGVLVKTF